MSDMNLLEDNTKLFKYNSNIIVKKAKNGEFPILYLKKKPHNLTQPTNNITQPTLSITEHNYTQPTDNITQPTQSISPQIIYNDSDRNTQSSPTITQSTPTESDGRYQFMLSKKKNSPSQMYKMLEFMEQFGDLFCTKSQGDCKEKWIELTELLNSDKSGIQRPVKQWKKVWSDWKAKTKLKYLKKRHLAKYEERILSLMKNGRVVQNNMNKAPPSKQVIDTPLECGSKLRKSSTKWQRLKLLEFMEEHGDLLSGMNPGTNVNQKWMKLTEILNSHIKIGGVRTVKQWKKAWADVKSKTMRNTGHLTKYQERVKAVLLNEKNTNQVTTPRTAKSAVTTLRIPFEDPLRELVASVGLSDCIIKSEDETEDPWITRSTENVLEDEIVTEMPSIASGVDFDDSPPKTLPVQTNPEVKRRRRRKPNFLQLITSIEERKLAMENRRLSLEENKLSLQEKKEIMYHEREMEREKLLRDKELHLHEREKLMHEKEMERCKLECKRLEIQHRNNELLENLQIIVNRMLKQPLRN